MKLPSFRQKYYNNVKFQFLIYIFYIKDARKYWDEVTNHPDGLSGDEIKNLYHRSGESACKSYIIPTNQDKLGMHGLVFRNMHNRRGAQEESDVMVRALLDIGMHVEAIEWNDFHYLRSQLKENVARVKDKCSLLIVCIMAHGFAGHVKGSYNSSHGEINILFAEVTGLIPEFIPVVSLLLIFECFIGIAFNQNQVIKKK